MARFGSNLRDRRKSLGLNQKELAAQLRNEDGTEMQQATISKFEALDWAPRPDTVRRLAEGIAAISCEPANVEAERLLAGVSSRFDAVQAQRAADADPIARLRELIDQLPPDKRADLVDVLERHTLAALTETIRKGA
jgi:transcriptional regulator with XRE-family HTH domain